MAENPFVALAPQLASGRPLLLGADIEASLRQQGVDVAGPGSLGKLLRARPDLVEGHYQAEVEAGADVLLALTSETTPRVLAQVGMAFRSAALTSSMVDRALEAAERSQQPVVVAGVLGGESVAPLDVTTLVDEHSVHAARLAAAGAGLILARGIGSRTELMAAVVAAATTGLPTWAVVEVDHHGRVLDGDEPEAIVTLLEAAGASAVLFETSVDNCEVLVQRYHRTWPLPVGLLIDALSGVSPAAWAETIGPLIPPWARMIGGGRDCTDSHTAALARWLQREPRRLHPSHRPTANRPSLPSLAHCREVPCTCLLALRSPRCSPSGSRPRWSPPARRPAPPRVT